MKIKKKRPGKAYIKNKQDIKANENTLVPRHTKSNNRSLTLPIWQIISGADSEEDLKRIFNQERKFQTKYFGDVEVVVKGEYNFVTVKSSIVKACQIVATGFFSVTWCWKK